MFLELEKLPSEATAVIDDRGSKCSYKELCDFSDRLAQFVTPRTVVFMLCENCLGALAGYLGFMSADAVPLLLSAAIDRELLAELLDVYTPAYIWVPTDKVGDFPDAEPIFKEYSYTLLKTGAEPYPLNDELSMLLTTSGSTGSPKLVRHSRKNPVVNARNVAAFFGFKSEDRGMCDLPMQYTMGLNVILSHLVVGATVLLASQNLMSPDFWRFFKEQRATDFTGVPFSYEVLDKLRFFRMKLPDLRILAEGGGRLSDEMFQKLAAYARDNDKQFFATFGTTETTARLAFLPPELACDKTGSIGRAIPGGELFLIGADGKPVVGEGEGEMGYRGDNVTLGYALCRQDLQKGDERFGEYITGDIAKRDADGCYYIIGRKSRFLKLYGLRISLDRCEALIKTRFGIECACTGDDKQLRIYFACDGEQPSEAEVKAYICEKTSIFSASVAAKRIESIPRNDSGKIRYAALS